MARVPVIRVLSVAAAVLILYTLSVLFKPQVVYVDSTTNQVLSDFKPHDTNQLTANLVTDAKDVPPELKETNQQILDTENEKVANPIEKQEQKQQEKTGENANALGQEKALEKESSAAEKEKAAAAAKEAAAGKEKSDASDKEKMAAAQDAAAQDGAKDAQSNDKDAEKAVVPENSGSTGAEHKKVKATFVTLARNKELYSLITSIKGVEDRFNHRYHYDWVFLNDEPFSDEFKDLTTAIVSGNTKYGLIPKEHWSYPDWIDLDKAAASRKKMKEDKIIYGDSESYRHMCRFESGFFWRNPLLDDYDWYWRVEPDTTIHCDLEYDLFKWMEDNNKVYGFTISIHEFRKTIPSLWDHTKDFLKLHPEYVAENNMMDFISNDNGETYNLCHFWSNFEIASLNFWRSPAYRDYFEYLDKQGGFFYERWGDAPIHSIAAALFLPRDKIHYFDDVGYRHGVYTQCPIEPEFRHKHKCYCDPTKDFTFRGYSCGKKYFEVNKLKKPQNWEQFT